MATNVIIKTIIPIVFIEYSKKIYFLVSDGARLFLPKTEPRQLLFTTK